MADNLTLSLPGQDKLSGASDALFMKIFSGEVLAAFDEVNIMKDLHRVRTISHGKSAAFPVLGKATARYHTPGTPILGSNQIATSEHVINVDDLLIADVAIYDLDDAKNHYDVRTEYSRQLGFALAREFDKKTMRVGILAARSAGLIADEPGGSQIEVPSAYTAEDLITAMFACAQTFDEKDVLEWERNLILRPADYFLLAQDTKVLNADWHASGNFAKGIVNEVAGIRLIKSNNLPNTSIEAVTGEKNTYNGDFTSTVGLCMQREAIGTVKLKDLTVQKSGADFNVVYQSTLMVAKYAQGHGILRPGCAIEIKKAA